MTDSIFNYDKTDYERPQLFFGQKLGLFDTIHKSYPAIWELYKTQCSLNWSEDEFNYSSCNADFKSASRSVYDMMIKTLAWQFEADSVASRSIAPVLAPFITSSELWAAWLKISEIECLTYDHEVLTPGGWRNITSITDDDLVAQWSPSTEEITFVRPTNRIAKPYNGTIIEYSTYSGNLSQAVTENHRMPVVHPYPINGEAYGTIFREAKDLKLHGANALPVAGKTPVGNGVGMTPREKILVAVQADGSIAGSKYNGNYSGMIHYRFHLSKQRKIDRLFELAGEAGYELVEDNCKRNEIDGSRVFRVMVPMEEYEWGAKSFDWINFAEINSKWCSDFVEELGYWDGNITKGGNVRYISSNRSTIDIAQTIGHLAGYRGHVTIIPPKENVLFSGGRRHNTKESYQLYFTERTYINGNTIEVDRYDYSGMVYCLSVPSTAFLVRRNGAISVTGNCIHSAAYSEIIRNSFDDPSVIFDELLAVEEAHSRLSRVVEVFAEGYDLSHRYALGLADASQENYNTLIKMIVALYCMERIQFMASFAVTFAICDTGMFQPIGKCIQKIAQDELEVHAELDRVVLELEFRTERGRTALDQISDDLRLLVEEVIDSELEWVDYLFSEGRELVGMTPDRLKSWTLYCAKDVYATLGVESKYDLPEVNPLRFMEKWLNISKTQASPQEQDIAAYKVGILRRTDSDTVFDADF